jgi:hypothetical protein
MNEDLKPILKPEARFSLRISVRLSWSALQ